MRHLGPVFLLVLAACSASASGPHLGMTEPHDASVDEASLDASRSGDTLPVVETGLPDSGIDAGQVPSGAMDASFPDAPGVDASDVDASNPCSVAGAPGTCTTLTACAALGDHTSFSGYCPGPSSIECCIVTPSTADNPPTPAGYELMAQSQVTSAMTTWAVMILDAPTAYPMFSTVMQTFGTQPVLARVEWHPPDFQNSVVHRGVTLYVPT